ncbi:tRNA (adenosine(37)-N6)-threonylcarbamoyltransferase complex transferase subunit TsaD, partial [Acinetobacter baumannii]
KEVTAVQPTGRQRVVIAAGVRANIRLRQQLEPSLARLKAQVYYAEPALCTENGAMIAFAGYQRLKAGQHDGLAVPTTPRWPRTELTIP